MNFPTKIAIIAVILLTILVLPAADAARNNKVSWATPAIATQVVTGETITISTMITFSENVDSASFWVTPGLEPFVSVLTADISGALAGEEVPVEIKISVSSATLPTSVDGTIHVRYGPKTIAKPLPVSLEFVWPGEFEDNLLDGVAFRYPDYGRSARVLVQDEEPGTRRYRVQVQLDNGEYSDELFLSIVDYSQGLDAWLIENVDPSGMLVGSDALSRKSYNNGTDALILEGAIPDTFGEIYGPVSSAYAANPTGTRIVVANVSQGSSLALSAGTEDTGDIVAAIISGLEF